MTVLRGMLAWALGLLAFFTLTSGLGGGQVLAAAGLGGAAYAVWAWPRRRPADEDWPDASRNPEVR